MRIVDAGVIVEMLAGGLDRDLLGDEELDVPHLLDSEVTNALRRLVLHGNLTEDQGAAAMEARLATATGGHCDVVVL